MTTQPPPPPPRPQILDTPAEVREQIWKELVRATHDRHHAWRTPVLATVNAQGRPNARTVVLRKASAADGGTIEIYTDRRSPKVSELMAQPSACLVFWSARLSWQLRVAVDVSVQVEGPYIDSLWQNVKHTRAAGDYLGLLPPGQALPDEPIVSDVSTDDSCDDSTDDPSATDTDQTVQFAVLTARVSEIDWLELGRGQHRRAKIFDDQWQWLAP